MLAGKRKCVDVVFETLNHTEMLQHMDKSLNAFFYVLSHMHILDVVQIKIQAQWDINVEFFWYFIFYKL